MATKNCQKCKSELNPAWFFCPMCGSSVQAGSVMQEYSKSTEAHAPVFSMDGNKYGAGVRAQVLEVIVLQAQKGAPWKEICAGPMAVNNITIADIEAELKRRGDGGSPALVRKPKPGPPSKSSEAT
ncbi:MAG: hypothetical protein WCT03_15915 [Candidatus Obscuribacterales bacterium]|jgi:hypothetical protein